jgi:hypothetical protein
MKKIGLLALALVLALGAVGVGYAHWLDTVYINQTVETGDVKVGVFGVADKLGDEKNVVGLNVTHANLKWPKEIRAVPGGTLTLPAPLPGPYDFYESVTVDITNYYPSVSVREDFYIGNAGSIPVHLWVTLTVNDPDGVYDHLTISWVKYLIKADGTITAEASGIGKATVGGSPDGAELGAIRDALEGQQLHQCDTVLLWVDKHLQQEAPQNSEPAKFTLKVEGIQYNYPWGP